ncbi:hypothetical protein BJY18_007081 [Amycolatopsis jiangsuensis]|uniref:Mutator family transposase n=1 Tax=Amycolatopsis jiangsuensis TaxID=1181879 RepID=A0A840J3E7_9PSEU|nr:hypothetical protein [Amycolatopsis jiangsuensis]
MPAASGSLPGVRVIELGTVVAGPFGGRMLSVGVAIPRRWRSARSRHGERKKATCRLSNVGSGSLQGQLATYKGPRHYVFTIGVTVDGRKDVLGLWMGTGGEGAKFWMGVLVDLKNRGVTDVFFLVCDGLKGLPEVVANVWPHALVQTFIVHLVRNTFRLAARQHWDALKRDVKPLETAPSSDAALVALDELEEKRGGDTRR